jgi:hypothetical protein
MPGTSENGIKNLAELGCRLRGGFMNPFHEQRPPGVREGNQHERNACPYGGLPVAIEASVRAKQAQVT